VSVHLTGGGRASTFRGGPAAARTSPPVPVHPRTVNPPTSAMPAPSTIGRIWTVPAPDRPGCDGCRSGRPSTRRANP